MNTLQNSATSRKISAMMRRGSKTEALEVAVSGGVNTTAGDFEPANHNMQAVIRLGRVIFHVARLFLVRFA